MLISMTSACYSLWLSGLRRPVHDTFLGTIHSRSWHSALMHASDWPWWNSSSRYGFSLSSLYWSPVYTDPIGVFISYVLYYDVGSYGLDLFLHGALGAAGAYLVARNLLRTELASVALAVSFVGAGVVASSSIAGVVHPGYMTLPWVFFALTRVSQANAVRTVIGAGGLLAASLAWLVASGYPATWITLPVFALPFTLVLAGTSVARLVRTFAACALAGMLGAAIMAPWIVETVATPAFGGAVRNAIDPNEGSLPVSGVWGLMLANPQFFPGAEHTSRQPVYIGLISGLALLLRAFNWVPAATTRVRPVAALVGFAALVLSTLPLVSANVARAIIPVDGGFEWPRENLAVAGLVAVLVATVPLQPNPWTRVDAGLASTTALAWVCATNNPLGNLLRPSLPPFIWSRWSYYYLGIAVLTGLILAWRLIETATLAAPTRTGKRSWNLIGYALVCVGLVTASTLFTPSAGAPISGGGARIGLATAVWVMIGGLVFALSGVIYWWSTRRGATNPRLPLWILLFGAPATITALTLLLGLSLRRNEAFIHAYLELPPPDQLSIDLFHALLVIGAAAPVWRFAPRHRLLQGIALIAIADIVLAAPRYLSDTDMVIGGQPFASLSVHRSFDFTGTHRDTAVRGDLAGMTAKRPGIEPFPILMPHVRAMEESFGTPDLFDRFAHFPSTWTEVAASEVDVRPEAFGWEPRPEVRTRPGIKRAPDCPNSPTVMPVAPSATVVDFRSSIVGVRVTSDCTRLLVYSDSWALGWSATVDGTPAPVLRVNEAIRGVIIPAGEHDLIWTYRPAYCALTKWISISGLLVTGACLAWGLWPDRFLGRQPAR